MPITTAMREYKIQHAFLGPDGTYGEYKDVPEEPIMTREQAKLRIRKLRTQHTRNKVRYRLVQRQKMPWTVVALD